MVKESVLTLISVFQNEERRRFLFYREEQNKVGTTRCRGLMWAGGTIKEMNRKWLSLWLVDLQKMILIGHSAFECSSSMVGQSSVVWKRREALLKFGYVSRYLVSIWSNARIIWITLNNSVFYNIEWLN